VQTSASEEPPCLHWRNFPPL